MGSRISETELVNCTGCMNSLPLCRNIISNEEATSAEVQPSMKNLLMG